MLQPIIAVIVCAAILPSAQTDSALRQSIQKQFEATAAYRAGDTPRALALLRTMSLAEQRKATEVILDGQGKLRPGDIAWTGRQLRALATLHMEAALQLQREDPNRPPPQEMFAHIELGRMLYAFVYAVLKETSDEAARWQLLLGLEYLLNARMRLAYLVLNPACQEYSDYGPLLLACGTLHETVSADTNSAGVVGIDARPFIKPDGPVDALLEDARSRGVVGIGTRPFIKRDAPVDSLLEDARSRRIDHLRQARGYFERAIAVDPADTEARLRLGNVAFQLGDDRVAEEVLMRLLDTPTVHAEDAYLANIFLARVKERQNQLEAAGASYDRAIALAPGQTALIGRSLNAQRRGNVAEAATLAERAATIKTIEDPWWRYPLGQYWLPAQILEALRKEARQ